MSITNAVRVALENHLNTTPSTPAPALPAIAWPNVPYAPVKGTPYVRADFVPTLRRPAVVGPNPEQRMSGLYILTVFTPEYAGAAAGTTLADKLLTRFNGSSAILATGLIVRIEYSEARMPLHEPPFYAIPVEIGWYAYAR